MLYRSFFNNTCRLFSRNMSQSYKIYVTRSDYPVGIAKLQEKFQVDMWKEPSTVPRDVFLNSIAGVHGIYCCLNDKIDKATLDAAGPNLKVVSTMSVGHDHIDKEECKKRGIRIGYNPDVLTDATAELTMALLLCTSRRLVEAIEEAKTGGWQDWGPTVLTGPGLAGATVGIFGFGRIGQAVAKRVKSFGTSRILYTSNTEKEEAKEFGAVKVPFEKLLTDSDFIICCSSLNPNSAKIFNKQAFKMMKNKAIFVNTSRGGVVDQEALIEALETRTIAAAGLDVTTPEPLPLDSPLFKLRNCVVLPHIGSAAVETRNMMGELTALNIITALEGKKMPAELVVY